VESGSRMDDRRGHIVDIRGSLFYDHPLWSFNIITGMAIGFFAAGNFQTSSWPFQLKGADNV
jgi:hypothetical protein